MALDDRTDRIDHDGPRLVWEQVAEDIEHDMKSGALDAGAKLPGELDLANRYGVSRVTVRRVVKEFVARRMLVVVHGRGTYVTPADQWAESPPEE